MFDLIKTVIVNRTYIDLNTLLAKVKRLWIQGDITEAQYDELLALARNNAPVKEYAVQAEIDQLWKAVHTLEAQIHAMEHPAQTEPGEQDEEPSTAEIPEWVQPTGAHDAYQKGDKVNYNGDVYESLIDGNVWSPDVYPAGWQKC